MTDWCSSEVCGLLHWAVSMSDSIAMIVCTREWGMENSRSWVFAYTVHNVHGESHAHAYSHLGHLPLRLGEGEFGLVKRL